MFGRKEYKISLNTDEWVTPEETLIDSGSEHSDLERPIPHGAFRFTFLSAVFLFLLVFAFSFKLAVSEHEGYARIALDNKSVNFFIPPPRGLVFDRLGQALVKNLASFDLLVISKEVREDKDNAQIDKIADILGIPREEFGFSVDENSGKSSIFFAAKELNKDQVLELRYLSPKGFYVVPDTNRYYVDGHQFSSVLGYIGKVNIADLNKDYYKPTDTIGRLGVELQYEELLRGEHGKIFFSKDATEFLDRLKHGQETTPRKENLNIDPVPGRNLVLNIDYDLQKKLYNELYGSLVGANLSRGAAIIQNPANRQVLAMAGFPSYANN